LNVFPEPAEASYIEKADFCMVGILPKINGFLETELCFKEKF